MDHTFSQHRSPRSQNTAAHNSSPQNTSAQNTSNAPSEPPLVELRGVSHRSPEIIEFHHPYLETCSTISQPSHMLLDSINLCLHRGESWAILGPNGAGKTLLLKIIAGLLWPNAGGTILRAGQSLTDLRELSRHIGWVSSRMTESIPPQETAIDTVVSGRLGQLGLTRFEGLAPSADDYDHAFQILRRIECEPLKSKPFGVLSQGERQKILLARALATQPWAIILDEPCSGLDPGSRERFLATLANIFQQPDQPAVLFVTHHIEEIIPQIETTLVLNQGKIHQIGLTREILNQDTLELIFGIAPRQVINSCGRQWPIW